MKPPAHVLVVVTRRIGDVLLTTPLIRSLKRAWPQAQIDVLVFAGTEGVLAGNPDIRQVITIAERPSISAHLALATRIFRRYDLALSVVPSDRPTVYAWLAAPARAGLVVDEPKQSFKKSLLGRWVAFDNSNTHTVLMHLKLADAIGIAPVSQIVLADSNDTAADVARRLSFDLRTPFAVFHPFPKFNYKMWRQIGRAHV